MDVGSTFGAYRIDGVIRHEELSVVYRATQSGLDRPVALKVIGPSLAQDPASRERFTTEARAAAADPGGPAVYEIGEQDGRLYLATALVEPSEAATGPIPPGPPTAPMEPPTDPQPPPAAAPPPVPPQSPVMPPPPIAPQPVAPHQSAAGYAAPARAAAPKRRVWPAVLVALLAVGAAAAVVVVLGADDKDSGGSGQAVSFSDPAASATAEAAATRKPAADKPASQGPARVTDSIKVGDQPDGLAVGNGAVWVANKGDGNLVRINPDTSKVTEIVHAGEGPDSVLAAGGKVYVTTQDDGGYLQRFVTRPRLKKAGPGIFLGPDPESLALDGNGFWVTVSGEDHVRRADLTTGELVGEPIVVGTAPVGVDAADGRVWVANTGSGSVTMRRTGSGPTETAVGQNPRELVVSDGFVWVVLTDEDAVVRLDAETGKRVGPPIAVGDSPHKIAAGFGSLWVTNSRDSTVSQIDARKHEVVRTIKVDATPLGIAAGLGAVWVGARDGGTVVRIEP